VADGCDAMTSTIWHSNMQGVDKIMETRRNWGIELVGYIERTSVGNGECSSSVCLLCSARVSASLNYVEGSSV
jgi:hypothetical protein